MSELVCRTAKSFLNESKPKPENILTNACLIPAPEELTCKAPDYNDNIEAITDLLQKEKTALPPKIISLFNSPAIENTETKTIESITRTAGKVTSALNKVPGIVANIAEIESDSALMLRVSKMAGPAAKFLTESKAFQVAGKVVGNPLVAKGAGALGVISGGFEIKNGIKEINKGNGAEGAYHIADGGSNVIAGGGLMLGSATVASGGAAFGIGLGVGHFGDNSVKELGWLKDSNGKAESVSDRLGDKMWNVHESVVGATGNDVLGHVAAIGSGLVLLPAAGVVAVGGALVNGTQKLGEGLSDAWNYIF